jgi:hypothetical protein
MYWARLYKKEYGFNPYFISSVNQCYQLRTKVNPYYQVSSLENKAMVDVYLPGIPFPDVFVRSINGSFYDKQMQPLSFEQAVGVLRSKSFFCHKAGIGYDVRKGG